MALSRRRAQNKRIEPQFSLPTFGVQQKLGVAFTVLVLGLIITLLYIVESRYRTSIVAQVEKRGATIAEQLAAVSRNALMTYDWIALIQDVNNVSRDPDVLYALILQRDGEPVAESKDPSFLGNPLLPEHVSQKAIETLETLVQYIPKGVNVPSDYYDVAVPILTAKGQKWGTARVALSLQEMHAEIRKTRLWIVLVGGIGGALSLVAVAWLAGRIASPIQDLTEGTQAVARGMKSQSWPVTLTI